MDTYFNHLKQQAARCFDIDDSYDHKTLVRYKGESGSLFAFNHLYHDGTEVLLLRGKTNKGFEIGVQPVEVKERMVFSFLINISNLRVLYNSGLEGEMQKGDALVIHNQHAGLYGTCPPNSEFLFLSVLLQNESYRIKRELIDKHIPNLYDSEGFVLYLKSTLSVQLLALISGVDNLLNIESDFFIQQMKGRVEETIVSCLYEIARSESELIRYAVSSEKLNLANRIRELILRNTNEHHSIDNIALQVGASKTLIKQVFQQVYGIPIYTFYQNRRIIKAKQMLDTGEYSIMQVAYELDFSTPSNFSKFFKKMTKQTPREYLSRKII